MVTDPVMVLHDQGLSARQIAERTGRTRNAIIGHIYRVKRRGPPKPPSIIDRETVLAAFDTHGGNLAAVARELGITEAKLRHHGFRGRKIERTNLAKDPNTRAVLAAIDRSGLSDVEVAKAVGLGRTTIRTWRKGRKGHKFLLECVMALMEKTPPVISRGCPMSGCA